MPVETARKKSIKDKATEFIGGIKHGKRRKKKTLTLQDFKYDSEVDSVGTGHLAEAFKAKIYDESNSCEYEVVIKVMNKKQLLSEDTDVMQEIDIHRNLRHENICRFFGFFYDETSIALILEYCDKKSLFDYIHDNKDHGYKMTQGRPVKVLQEEETAWFMRDIANGLRHCHENGVIHRDIKPENLLVDANRRIKISDFGMAKRILNDDTVVSDWLGTTDFLSPQICNEEPYKYDVDLWALGVVGFEMLTGRTPFYVRPKSSSDKHNRKAQEATIELIKEGHYTWPSDISVSRQARDLIDGLLEKNPDKRLPLTYVLNHTWIVKHEKADVRETVLVT